MPESLLEIHAREKSGQGPEWEVYLWESYPKTNGPRLFTQLTGAVAPRITRGPRKGRRNWKKRDKATEQVVVITPADEAAFRAKWVQETGKCGECLGERQVWNGWSAAEGTRYKPCDVCDATGVAKVTEGATA